VLNSAACGQLQSQHEYKQQQYDSTRQNKYKTTKERTKTMKNDPV
jgi:hypothetical protein